MKTDADLETLVGARVAHGFVRYLNVYLYIFVCEHLYKYFFLYLLVGAARIQQLETPVINIRL